MDLRPNRQAMADALKAAGIQFPESATLIQLRPLYETLVAMKRNEERAYARAAVATTGADVSAAYEMANVNIPDANKTEVSETCAITASEADAIAASATDAITASATDAIAVSATNADPAARDIYKQLFVHTDVTNVSAVPCSNNSAADCDAENELKNLRMRLEVLKLQQQIRELESREQPLIYSRRIDLSELDAAIPPFSGDDHHDIIKWFDQFEDYSNIYGYSPK